jgi:hypothetical protein
MWYMPCNSSDLVGGDGRIKVQEQPGQKVSKTLS